MRLVAMNCKRGGIDRFDYEFIGRSGRAKYKFGADRTFSVLFCSSGLPRHRREPPVLPSFRPARGFSNLISPSSTILIDLPREVRPSELGPRSGQDDTPS
jgi:hypothetical protein